MGRPRFLLLGSWFGNDQVYSTNRVSFGLAPVLGLFSVLRVLRNVTYSLPLTCIGQRLVGQLVPKPLERRSAC